MSANYLSNFSVLKAFTDSGKSILDCLVPFVEYAMATLGTEYMDTIDIKRIITDDCGIDIPFSTLKTLLKRLKRLNHITDYESFSRIRVVKNVNIESNEYKTKMQDFNRDSTQLLVDCYKYCGFTFPNAEMPALFLSYIQTYQKYLDFSEEIIDVASAEIEPKEEYVRISEYILEISKSNTQHFTTFKGMFYGYILSQFVAHNTDIANTHKLKALTVFVDSNYLLRVLEMQSPLLCSASIELLKMMKNRGITVATLPEIIAEVRAVLNRHYYRYINDKDSLLKLHGSRVAQIDGVIGAFFRKNITNTDIQEFIDNLECEVKRLNISISSEELDTSAKYLDKEQEKIAEFKMKNSKIENYGSVVDQNRAKAIIAKKSLLDARVLGFIRAKRRTASYRFDLCKCLFLTCDNVVYSVNSYYHKPHNTIPEAIIEGKLTNALFISSPQNDNDVPVSLLVSIFKSSSYLSFELLSRFHKDLQKYIHSNPEQEQYLASVFSNQNLFSDLDDWYGDEQNTDEAQFLKTLFEKAKEQESKNKIDHETKTTKMQAEIEMLKGRIDELSAPSPQIEEKKDIEPKKAQNTAAEKILKFSWLMLCIVMITGSIVLLLLKVDFFTSTKIESVLLWFSPLLFSFLFTINSFKTENMDKIMNKFIYSSSTDSSLQIFFLLILHSFWAIIPLVISIIISFANNK